MKFRERVRKAHHHALKAEEGLDTTLVWLARKPGTLILFILWSLACTWFGVWVG